MTTEMRSPKRNEIRRVKLVDPATSIGLEMFAVEKERPCLFVSADEFNESRKTFTVVPLTDRTDGKENSMSRWAASVWHEPHPSGHYFTPSKPDKRWKRSLIDCAQLWTIRSDDVLWHEPHATLEELAEANVDSALQVLLGGCIRLGSSLERHSSLAVQEGDIVEADLPGQSRQLCLVVSSTSVDYLRENIRRKPDDIFRGPPCGREKELPPWPLGHVTIVPVSPFDSSFKANTRTRVKIHDELIAECHVIFTIDHRARRMRLTPHSCIPDAMSCVRKALRTYLSLR